MLLPDEIRNVLLNSFEDKHSIRCRNKITEVLFPLVTSWAKTYKQNSSVPFDVDDAIANTCLLILDDFSKYTDIDTFLKHIFGYLKYYKYNQKPWLLCSDLPINILERKVLEFHLHFRCTYNKQKSEKELDTLLSCLSEKQQIVISMFLVDNYSKQEIANILNISVDEVRKLYTRGLKQLRAII